MLVKLTSNTSGEIIMFAEHLRHLFEIIGKECTARGVFTKEQLPDAIARLHRAVDEDKQAVHDAERKAHDEGVDEDDEAADEGRKSGRVGVHLAQRAHPLLNMMEWTLKEGGFILWETDQDF
jgi:rubrerythrin